MKFSLKTLAAAVVMAAAATGANAAIDNGSSGNGELFFNIWDANGSYSRDLNITIDAFQTIVAGGAFDLTFSADGVMDSFMAGSSSAGVRTGTYKFNVLANDNSGARRLLNTYTEATLPTTTKLNDAIRTAAGTEVTYLGFLNTALGANSSVAVGSTSPAWTGKSTFRDTIGGGLNFSNAGTGANNSFDNGLSFMRIDALSLGSAASVYNQYAATAAASEVRVYFDTNNALHIQSVMAAVPEPESYAMLLAGLGMIGFMAGRRNSKRA